MNRHIYPQTQNQYLLLFLSLADQLLYIESVSGDGQKTLIDTLSGHAWQKLMLMLCLLEIPDVLWPSRVLAQMHGVNALVSWLTAFHVHPLLERLDVQ